MAKIDAEAEEVRAVLELTQRVPMTRAEALFIEALFTRWLTQLTPAGGASAADVLQPGAPGTPETQPPADRTSDQASQPVPASQPST